MRVTFADMLEDANMTRLLHALSVDVVTSDTADCHVLSPTLQRIDWCDVCDAGLCSF